MTKVVFITGGSRGIGSALVKQFVSSGHSVFATSTSNSGAEAITRQIDALNGEGKGLILDLKKNNLSDFIAKYTAEFPLPDILINNAAIVRDNLFIRISDSDWEDVLQVNLTACFKLTKSFIRPMLKKRWGRVIFISSVVGLTGNVGQSNYAATKAGLSGLCKSLAREVGNRGITVNCVAPGDIETDMTKKVGQEIKDALYNSIPMRKFGCPDDIAYATLFLSSDQASYITGNTLNVNGGMFMP